LLYRLSYRPHCETEYFLKFWTLASWSQSLWYAISPLNIQSLESSLLPKGWW